MPAALRTQWRTELSEKFYIESVLMDSSNFGKLKKAGRFNPFDTEGQVVICSYNFASRNADALHTVPWDLIIMDEAHRLRDVYKSGNVTGKRPQATPPGMEEALADRRPSPEQSDGAVREYQTISEYLLFQSSFKPGVRMILEVLEE